MDKVEMAGSLVAQSWSIFIDETEKLVKVVKENADQMASKTLETLGTLFVEKRMNRKMYSEEHTRICNDLHKLQVGQGIGASKEGRSKVYPPPHLRVFLIFSSPKILVPSLTLWNRVTLKD